MAKLVVLDIQLDFSKIPEEKLKEVEERTTRALENLKEKENKESCITQE